MKEQVNLLLNSLDLGFEVDHIHALSGGRQHRAFLLQNSQQQKIILKQLNLSCWLGEYSIEHFEQTEDLAAIIAKHFDNSVSAMKFDGQAVIHHNNDYYMLIPWVTGEVKPSLNSEQCRLLGADLARMHSLCLKSNYFKPYKVLNESLDFELPVNKYIKQYNASYTNFKLPLLLSHRDINLQNLIWQSEERYCLIDWESAGLINPVVELIGMALNCANIESLELDWVNFLACIKGYRSVNPGLEFEYHHYPQLYYSWLRWMVYVQMHAVDLDVKRELEICFRALELLAYNQQKILDMLL
jgi:Ser/Thr protein kinase RdoA (MazF antagonist)